MGLGYALTQMDGRPGHEGERHIISFRSSKLKSSQQLWSPCEVESLSLLEGIEENNFYLMGCGHFIVESDCSALGGLKEKPLADIQNKRIQAIFARINQYNFNINHIPGTKIFWWNCYLVKDLPVIRPQTSTAQRMGV